MSGALSFRVAVSILLAALLLGRCTCDPDSVNRGDVNLISVEQEWTMGERLAGELAGRIELVRDPRAQTYVQQLGEKIVNQTELAGRTWQFRLVRDSALNAFALPGGRIYVHTGLIRAADNVSELAGVLAHEVAHVAARHSTERLTKVYGMEALARLLMGGEAGLLEQIAAQIVGQGTLAKFSRDDEREADRLGVRYARQAGYQPEGMVSMFQKMLQVREERPNIVEQFFATHPLTEERIAAAKERIQQLPATSADLVQRDPAFRRMQQRLDPPQPAR